MNPAAGAGEDMPAAASVAGESKPADASVDATERPDAPGPDRDAADARPPEADAPEADAPGANGPASPISPASAIDGLDTGGIVVAPSMPGSYLSPSAVYQPPPMREPTVMPLAGTAAPTAQTAQTARTASETRPSPDPAPRPGEAPLLADLPFDAPNTLSGWLVAIGSGVAAISFLLPWAPGIANYTSSWGLSSVANIPVLALLVVTVVLAVLPNRVAPWVRSGVLGMIGGSLFLGVLWPYVVGDFGAEFGAIVGGVGAIVLVAGGILAVAPRREPPPTG